MNRTYRRCSALSLAVGMVALGSVGCASSGPKGARQTQVEQESVVTVVAIDVPQRLVTVRDATGDTMTLRVDEQNKDFPQAAVGDRVRIRYQESIAVQLAKPGAGTAGLEVTEETSRPAAGQPSAKVLTEVKATVRIDSVQKRGALVSFTGPRGPRTVKITDPSMQDFARKLRPGDNVEVTYREAVALSLEPTQKK